MREVESNSILRWGEYFPDAVLVAWVQIREGRADYDPVGRVNQPSAGICGEYICKNCVLVDA